MPPNIHARLTPMFRRGTLGSILIVAFLAEAMVFIMAIHLIGFGNTLLLTLATGVIGAMRLRRSGQDAVAALRGLSGPPVLREMAFIDGIMHALGALLLLLPGFITDFLGLILIAPSGRRWIGRQFGVGEAPRPVRGRESPRVIDLEAEDWTRIDNARRG